MGVSAHDTSLAFRDTRRYEPGSYTLGKFPYHALVLSDGRVQQCLPFSYIAPAALKRLNSDGIHVALLGDFRKTPVPLLQYDALAELCRLIQVAFNWGLEMRGHTDTVGSSSDPNKECPGQYLDVSALVKGLDAGKVAALSTEGFLLTQGLVF